MLDNQQQYAQLGRLRESERDQIEEEVAAYVRGCSTNITKLQEMLRSVPAASPAKQIASSPDLLAHRQGMVLILSERLGTLTAAFDRLRSLRYRQLQQEEANRKRRTPPSIAAVPRTHAQLKAAQANGGSSGLRAAFDAVAQSAAASPQAGFAQEQVLVDEENAALQQELLSTTDQVLHAERSVREIATLNQMFSAAIMHQSQQIEKLYSEAVAATANISRANVQLDKAIRANRSGQKCMFILLLLASLGLLFLDWWYS